MSGPLCILGETLLFSPDVVVSVSCAEDMALSSGFKDQSTHVFQDDDVHSVTNLESFADHPAAAEEALMAFAGRDPIR